MRCCIRSTSPGCHNLWRCLEQRSKDEFTRLKNFFTWGGHGLLKGFKKWPGGGLQIFHSRDPGEREEQCSLIPWMGKESPREQEFPRDTHLKVTATYPLGLRCRSGVSPWQYREACLGTSFLVVQALCCTIPRGAMVSQSRGHLHS